MASAYTDTVVRVPHFRICHVPITPRLFTMINNTQTGHQPAHRDAEIQGNNETIPSVTALHIFCSRWSRTSCNPNRHTSFMIVRKSFPGQDCHLRPTPLDICLAVKSSVQPMSKSAQEQDVRAVCQGCILITGASSVNHAGVELNTWVRSSLCLYPYNPRPLIFAVGFSLNRLCSLYSRFLLAAYLHFS